MTDLKEAEQIEVNGKTLVEWAKTNPTKLEKMFEHEFDETLRDQMIMVYREHCMGGMSDKDRV